MVETYWKPKRKVWFQKNDDSKLGRKYDEMTSKERKEFNDKVSAQQDFINQGSDTHTASREEAIRELKKQRRL